MSSIIQAWHSLVVPSWSHWIGIVLASFVLEDPTTLYVSTLLSKNAKLWPYGLSALVFGLVIGDAILYVIGRFTRRLHRHWQSPPSKHFRSLTFAVFAARFIPGLRIPVYGYAGFRRLPFQTFLVLNVVSSLVWSILLLLTGGALYANLGWGGVIGLWSLLLAAALLRKRFANDRKTPRVSSTPKES